MTDTVLTYLDSYCERAGNTALLAEPLNAITNLFFIAAALLAARALISKPRQGGGQQSNLDLWLLIFSLFAIGIGSGAWHLVPNQTTLLMDVIPITLFINIYIIASLRRLFNQAWRKVFGWWLVYTIVGIVAQMKLPPDLLNGTIMYIPTYATLVVMTFALARRDRAAAKVFAIMTTVWSLSLIFRTIDYGICSQLALGTHFLWHTLNAVVLWRLLMVLIQKR
jgi:hypothetical protein